jgi:hypothetical protein
LGTDETVTLRSWGLPVTEEDLAKVKAAVEEASKPPDQPPADADQPAEEGGGEQKPAAADGG